MMPPRLNHASSSGSNLGARVAVGAVTDEQRGILAIQFRVLVHHDGQRHLSAVIARGQDLLRDEAGRISRDGLLQPGIGHGTVRSGFIPQGRARPGFQAEHCAVCRFVRREHMHRAIVGQFHRHCGAAIGNTQHFREPAVGGNGVERILCHGQVPDDVIALGQHRGGAGQIRFGQVRLDNLVTRGSIIGEDEQLVP